MWKWKRRFERVWGLWVSVADWARVDLDSTRVGGRRFILLLGYLEGVKSWDQEDVVIVFIRGLL